MPPLLYIRIMLDHSAQEKLILFFENISNYYGDAAEITSGLHMRQEGFSATTTTWNLLEFQLIRSAYRKEGGRFMLEGDKMYYEIAASRLVDFKQPGRHTFEFIELYGHDTYRITKLKFNSRY